MTLHHNTFETGPNTGRNADSLKNIQTKTEIRPTSPHPKLCKNHHLSVAENDTGYVMQVLRERLLLRLSLLTQLGVPDSYLRSEIERPFTVSVNVLLLT